MAEPAQVVEPEPVAAELVADPEAVAQPEAAVVAAAAADGAAGEPEPEPVADGQPDTEPAAAAAEVVPDPAAEQRASELAAHTARLLGRFRVGAAGAAAPLDEGLGWEASAEVPTLVPTSAPAVKPAPIKVVTPEPTVAPPSPMEPVVPAAAVAAATAAAQAAPIVEAQPAPEPVAPAPGPPAAPAPTPSTPTDVVEMPTWPLVDRRRPVQPQPADVPAATQPPLVAAPPADAVPPVAPAVLAPPPVAPFVVAASQSAHPAAPPQWPAPRTPGPDLSTTPFWASGDAARAAVEAGLWNASAQEVIGARAQAATPDQAVAQPGVQSCVKCGLSLSSNARFCRRCGSPQG